MLVGVIRFWLQRQQVESFNYFVVLCNDKIKYIKAYHVSMMSQLTTWI